MDEPTIDVDVTVNDQNVVVPIYLDGGDDPSFAQIDAFLRAHFNAKAVYLDPTVPAHPLVPSCCEGLTPDEIIANHPALAATPQADQWQVRADDDDETLWTLAVTPQADPAEPGLRALFARYIEHHGDPEQWDDEDGWCMKHLPSMSEVVAALVAKDAER